jgi:hypothetical protein
MHKNPDSVQEFVGRQTTLPVSELWKPDPKALFLPYGSYWYRAVACMLLGGRVSPKSDGYPNRTDINRVCEEANFNQFLFETVGRFLVAADVVGMERYSYYREGQNLAVFWSHDVNGLRRASRQGVTALTRDGAGTKAWTVARDAPTGLADLLTLFFGAFKGLALQRHGVGQAIHDFAGLPQTDLARLGKALGVQVDSGAVAEWQPALNEKGQRALIDALYSAEWAYYGEHRNAGWVFASPPGLGMLGLEEPPPAPELSPMLKVVPGGAVFAGADLPLEKLVPLFRCCVVKRIDQVYELQIDRKRLAQLPAEPSPAAQLRQALADAGPLPPSVASLLETESQLGGTVAIRWCSALVKVDDAQTREAIRKHPQLKGYLEPGAPPGYLLIKPASRPDNFVRRCQELGFKVERLKG